MRRLVLVFFLLPLLFSAVGCSSRLTRREAKYKIDAMLRPYVVGNRVFIPESSPPPGYELSGGYYYNYNPLLSIGRVGADVEKPLEKALESLGYVTLQDAGPADIPIAETTQHFDSTVIVSLTDKVGRVVGGIPNSKSGITYQSGFECLPAPAAICNLPLVEISNDYKVTGIVQDQIHARVDILIPWRLTQLGIALKPYAKSDEGKSDYDLEFWEKFLNAHSASGDDHAEILFQKFDDGWRIVDGNGKS